MARSNRSAETEAFWRWVLDEHHRSGLSVRAFCRQEGLSEPSFYAWRREITKRDAAAQNRADENPRPDKKKGRAANRKPQSNRKPPTNKEPASLIPVVVLDAPEKDSPADARRTPVGLAERLEMVTPGGFTLRFGPAVELPRVVALLEALQQPRQQGPARREGEVVSC